MSIKKTINRIKKGYNLIEKINNLSIKKNNLGLNLVEMIDLKNSIEEYEEQTFIKKSNGLGCKVDLEYWLEFIGRNIQGIIHPLRSTQAAYYDIFS